MFLVSCTCTPMILKLINGVKKNAVHLTRPDLINFKMENLNRPNSKLLYLVAQLYQENKLTETQKLRLKGNLVD